MTFLGLRSGSASLLEDIIPRLPGEPVAVGGTQQRGVVDFIEGCGAAPQRKGFWAYRARGDAPQFGRATSGARNSRNTGDHLACSGPLEEWPRSLSRSK
jgi:hypothetical protein